MRLPSSCSWSPVRPSATRFVAPPPASPRLRACSRATVRCTGFSTAQRRASEPLQVRAGTSGWQYRDWRGPFYPEGIPQREWLAHYAERFAVVEVNNTFYNLPSEDAVRRWGSTAPHDFEFVLKASRYLS